MAHRPAVGSWAIFMLGLALRDRAGRQGWCCLFKASRYTTFVLLVTKKHSCGGDGADSLMPCPLITNTTRLIPYYGLPETHLGIVSRVTTPSQIRRACPIFCLTLPLLIFFFACDLRACWASHSPQLHGGGMCGDQYAGQGS